MIHEPEIVQAVHADYLRAGANVGDLQVNLVDKHERDRYVWRRRGELVEAEKRKTRRHWQHQKLAQRPMGLSKIWAFGEPSPRGARIFDFIACAEAVPVIKNRQSEQR